MRYTVLIGLFLLSACGGSLSDEQRKQLKEARENQEILRVTDAAITEAAFTQGRLVLSKLEGNNLSNEQIDSLAKSTNAIIRWLEAGSSDGREIEKQLIEAYLANAMIGEDQPDNIQRVGTDTLLYTKVVVEEMPDGRVLVKGTWNVYLAKKQLVRGLSK